MIITLWLVFLTIILVIHGYKINDLDDEIEAIKSWKPFVDICGIEIPKDENDKIKK